MLSTRAGSLGAIILVILMVAGSTSGAQQETLKLNGIIVPVEIIKDRLGISHIYTETDEDLGVAVEMFWAAASNEELAIAIDAILATEPELNDILMVLREGRPYAADVPTGRQLLSRQNLDGVEHEYVLHVPDSYDPATRYPVRIYLHGGVMRPKRSDGNWWPNDFVLARDDALVVFPASWEGSVWWETSQIENLAGLLIDLRRLYNLDENRAYLLGISDGASATYYHAFKATTPWAGFLSFNGHPVVLANPTTDVDGEMHVTNLRNKPFFVINGTYDHLYPAASVERYVRLFLEVGVSVDFRPQMDAGHDMSWWSSQSENIDSFVQETPRHPLPDRLTWETETTEMFNRAHWLRIDELGAVEGETDLNDYNQVASASRRVPLGINMLGELQDRPGLRVFDVNPLSIAGMSGIETNDIIVEINGIQIPGVAAFRNALIGFLPGNSFPVSVERSGVRVDLFLEYPADTVDGSRPAFPQRQPSGRVELERHGNLVVASTEGVRKFTLLLSPEQFDFSQPITVVTNGAPSFEGMMSPNVKTLLRWAAIDQDRSLLFTAELPIEVTPP